MILAMAGYMKLLSKRSGLPRWGERLSAGRLRRHLGLLELLKAVKNPKHKEHRQMLDWLGGQFDPGQFDLQKLNATLRGLEI